MIVEYRKWIQSFDTNSRTAAVVEAVTDRQGEFSVAPRLLFTAPLISYFDGDSHPRIKAFRPPFAGTDFDSRHYGWSTLRENGGWVQVELARLRGARERLEGLSLLVDRQYAPHAAVLEQEERRQIEQEAAAERIEKEIIFWWRRWPEVLAGSATRHREAVRKASAQFEEVKRKQGRVAEDALTEIERSLAEGRLSPAEAKVKSDFIRRRLEADLNFWEKHLRDIDAAGPGSPFDIASTEANARNRAEQLSSDVARLAAEEKISPKRKQQILGMLSRGLLPQREDQEWFQCADKPPTSARATESLPSPLTPEFTDPYVQMEFVLIPGGTYEELIADHPSGRVQEGSGVPGTSDELRPTVTIKVSPFYMGKFEVTQAQWERVMGTRPWLVGGQDLPVNMVGWECAREYAVVLGRSTGLPYRLPTAAEFSLVEQTEAAIPPARQRGFFVPRPVSASERNALGIYGIRSDPMEWISDVGGAAYGSKGGEVLVGPVSEPSKYGQRFSARGGSNPFVVDYDDVREPTIGFRLVLPIRTVNAK